MADELDFDWARLAIRFLFGFFPGILLGFGFWIQMCRPAGTLGPMEHVPRLVTAWLGLEQIVDSAAVGTAVVGVFAITSGVLVAVWPSIAKRFS
jgi:hypothetical protein